MRFLFIAFLITACAARAPLVPQGGKHHGMSFACAFDRQRDVRYGSAPSAAALADLKKLGVDWISIIPFGFQQGTSLRWGGERVWETDESLAAVTRQAHALGIRVMLKPHIWSRGNPDTRSWSEADWRTWFDAYGRFIHHYAALANDDGDDALSIGNEQKNTIAHEAEWRKIIADVRQVYRGPLTYGANFDEVFDVPFWDALDWIGVSGYFPLVDAPSPDRRSLEEAWQPIVDRLGRLATKWQRPILFTELGYRSADRAAWRQWEIPRDAPQNLALQRAAYEAFFDTVWPHRWVAGVYPWKWFSQPNHAHPNDNGYEIENKPAEEVVRRHYHGGS